MAISLRGGACYLRKHPLAQGGPVPEWDAEWLVDDALAAKLIRARFGRTACPQLVGTGFDNVVFRDGGLAWRIPRRKLGADLLRAEATWLPQVAGFLPNPVPAATAVGEPDAAFPWLVVEHPWIEGRTGCSADLADGGECVAGHLGHFLRALHALDVPPGAPPDGLRRADLAGRLPRLLGTLRRLDPPLPGVEVEALASQLSDLARSAPWSGPARWVHGDLYGRHVLVDARGLAGVIDWGDMHAGDPALDLAIAWSWCTLPARRALLDAYGSVDEATQRRSRFRALHYAILLWDYGNAVHDLGMRRLAVRALAGAGPGAPAWS